MVLLKEKRARKRSASSLVSTSTKKKRQGTTYDENIDLQISKDLYNEITTNADEVILPTNLKKYLGRVAPPWRREKKWRSCFQGKYKYKGSSHDSEKEAIDHVKEINIRNGWPIRNIVYRYGNEYYCHLTKGQLTLFAVEHMDIIQNNTWYASFYPKNKTYYAKTCEYLTQSHVYYHHRVYPNLKKGETVDHINKISLDNRPENMRVASRRTQILNRNILVNNTTGVTGVKIEKGNYCIAQWVDENHVPRVKHFSIKKYGYETAFKMAVAHRKYIEETLPSYILALQNK